MSNEASATIKAAAKKAAAASGETPRPQPIKGILHFAPVRGSGGPKQSAALSAVKRGFRLSIEFADKVDLPVGTDLFLYAENNQLHFAKTGEGEPFKVRGNAKRRQIIAPNVIEALALKGRFNPEVTANGFAITIA